jgi:hypothetical protein
VTGRLAVASSVTSGVIAVVIARVVDWYRGTYRAAILLRRMSALDGKERPVRATTLPAVLAGARR